MTQSLHFKSKNRWNDDRLYLLHGNQVSTFKYSYNYTNTKILTKFADLAWIYFDIQWVPYKTSYQKLTTSTKKNEVILSITSFHYIIYLIITCFTYRKTSKTNAWKSQVFTHVSMTAECKSRWWRIVSGLNFVFNKTYFRFSTNLTATTVIQNEKQEKNVRVSSRWYCTYILFLVFNTYEI